MGPFLSDRDTSIDSYLGLIQIIRFSNIRNSYIFRKESKVGP